MMKTSFLTLYNSIGKSEKVRKNQIMLALQQKKDIAISGTLGLHQSFTYLKSIIESITPESQFPKQIHALENLYKSHTLRNLAKVKYLIIIPEPNQLNLLYSISRLVSPCSTIARLDTKFNKSINNALVEQTDGNDINLMFPKSDIAFSVPTNSDALKTINPEWLILDHVSTKHTNALLKQFPQSKVMNISSINALKIPTKFEFTFETTKSSLFIRHHSESELFMLFQKKKSKIIVFPSEKLLYKFVSENNKKLQLVYLHSSNKWYPLVLFEPRFIIIATLSDIKGISFPFSYWIFYDMDPKVFSHHSRSEGINFFIHS